MNGKLSQEFFEDLFYNKLITGTNTTAERKYTLDVLGKNLEEKLRNKSNKSKIYLHIPNRNKGWVYFDMNKEGKKGGKSKDTPKKHPHITLSINEEGIDFFVNLENKKLIESIWIDKKNKDKIIKNLKKISEFSRNLNEKNNKEKKRKGEEVEEPKYYFSYRNVDAEGQGKSTKEILATDINLNFQYKKSGKKKEYRGKKFKTIWEKRKKVLENIKPDQKLSIHCKIPASAIIKKDSMPKQAKLVLDNGKPIINLYELIWKIWSK